MPKFTVNTKYGAVEVEADQQPSVAEVEEYVASQNADKTVRDSATESVNQATPSISSMMKGMTVESVLTMGGTILGGAFGTVVGGAGGTAVVPGPGTVAGAAKGAMLGATAGGALGAGVGSYLRQLMEVNEGTKKEVSTGQVVGSALMGAIPATAGAKLLAGATGYAKPILVRAIQGGATGVAGEVVEKAIDENRLPTWQEVKTPLMFGAAVGGGLGGVERRYAVNGNLISSPVLAQAAQAGTGLGVAGYVYNSERENGNNNALAVATMYGLMTYGGTHIPSYIMRQKQAAQSGKAAVLGPESVIGDQVVRHTVDQRSEMSSAAKYGVEFANDVNRIIDSSANPQQLTADWLSYISNRAPATILPNELLPYADKFRELRRENSRILPILYPKLATTFLENEDDYTRLSYRAFDSASTRGRDWDTDVARTKFLNELADDFQDQATKKGAPIARSQAEAYADNYMKRMVGDVGLIYSGGDIDTTLIGGLSSPLKKRKELSVAAREWLGEVKDPGGIAGITLQAQDRLIIKAKYDEQLAKYLIDSDIGKLANTANLPDDYVLLVGPENPTIGAALKDIKVPKQWADAFNNINSHSLFGDNGPVKAMLAFSAFSKGMKTIGNLPEAFAPQMLGNAVMMASGGMLNPVTLFRGMREAAYDLGWRGGKLDAKQRLALMEELRYARSVGVLRGGSDSQEIKSMLDASLGATSWNKWYQQAADVYSFPDTSFRWAIYKNNAKQMQDLGPEGVAFMQEKYFKEFKEKQFGTGPAPFSKEIIDRTAARITNETFPTYELIKRRLRQASAVGVANAFGSFEFEVMRNVKNMMVHNKYLLELSLKAQSPQTRRAAAMQFAQRSAGMVGTAAATAAVATYGSRMLGTSEEMAGHIKNILPTFDENKANVSKLNKDGTITYAPLNYLMPHANMMQALAVGATGGDALPYLKTTFLGDDIGPFFTGVTEMVTNTYYNTQVAIEDPRDNVKLFERLVTRAFLPQFVIGTLSRTEKAIRGDTNKLGTKYTLEDQIKRFGGVRAQTLDALGAASVRIRDIAEPLNQELTGYKRIIKGAFDPASGAYPGVNEEAIYRERNIRYERGQEKLAEIYRSLKAIGEESGAFDDEKIIEAFAKAGVPNRLIAGAAFGYTVPMTRGIHKNHGEIIKEVMQDPARRANVKDELRAIAGNDRRMYVDLMQSYQEAVMNERRGLTGLAKLFGGMTVGDGERAENIGRAMSTYIRNGNPEVADAFNRQLRKAGVITPDVVRQLKERADRF